MVCNKYIRVVPFSRLETGSEVRTVDGGIFFCWFKNLRTGLEPGYLKDPSLLFSQVSDDPYKERCNSLRNCWKYKKATLRKKGGTLKKMT